MLKRNNGNGGLVGLTEKFKNLLHLAFVFSALESKFKNEKKEPRKGVDDYIRNNKDGFEIDLSKGMDTEFGKIIVKAGVGIKLDKYKILKLVEEKKINVTTLLMELLPESAKSVDKCQKALGAHYDECATATKTETLQLNPNHEVKSRVDALFQVTIETEFGTEQVTLPEPKEKTPKKKPAKKAKSKKTKKAKDDLDSILDDDE